MFWKHESVIPARTHAFGSTITLSQLMAGGLLLVLLTFSACLQNNAVPTIQDQKGTSPSTSSPILTARSITPSPTSNLTPTMQKGTPTLQSITVSPTSRPTQGHTIITPTPVNSSAPRNHVPSGSSPLFVSITFTTSTTFDQAVAILKTAGGTPYPWTCDDPRTPVPPSLAQQRADFLSSHQLRLSYPDDNQLQLIASSPQVASVDPYPAYMCP